MDYLDKKGGRVRNGHKVQAGVLIRTIAGIFVIAAGTTWIVQEQLSAWFGAVQIIVGITLFGEATYQHFWKRDER